MVSNRSTTFAVCPHSSFLISHSSLVISHSSVVIRYSSLPLPLIAYTHQPEVHSLAGPAAALPVMLSDGPTSSLLDVGCGTGTWMRAALDLGLTDVAGIDGIVLPEPQLHVPIHLIAQRDLTQPFDLGRRFDVVLCLEVAEHLPEAAVHPLIQSLTRHSDRIFFSAACLGQPGQHHVHTQWPAYWQQQFNAFGFACDDTARWRIWDDDRIEPWYRQNLFTAQRDPDRAGQEPRLCAVIHPDLLPQFLASDPVRNDLLTQIESGSQPLSWYARLPFTVLGAKGRRFWRKASK